MKIVHTFLHSAHGPLRFENIGSGDRGVTGSEQALLFLAKTQASMGHQVVCYVPTDTPGFHEGVELVDMRSAWPRLRRMDKADVVIAWLSADPLRYAPPTALRVHSLQINDWLMNMPGYEDYVDRFVCVSEAHRAHLWKAFGAPEHSADKVLIIPNGVDITRFHGSVARKPLKCVYISSPDRGLHWLLSMWPEIRFAYPHAELHIFYEVQGWLDNTRGLISDVGLRARYVARRINELSRHGVVLRGPVAPELLAKELLSADFQLYPCDPISFTEGFGVAVLEACAAGVIPVITDADAFGEIYGNSGAVVVPRTGGSEWTDTYLTTVIKLMSVGVSKDERERVQRFAQGYAWPKVAEQWMAKIEQGLEAKRV